MVKFAMSAAVHRENTSEVGARVLEITVALAASLHGTTPPDVDLDFSLDRDFGLESLARAELLKRIEQEFGIELSDAMLAAADSVLHGFFGVLLVGCVPAPIYPAVAR